MIKLFKNKIIYENDINPTHEDYIKEKVDGVIPYLNNRIEIAKNFTLGDFFKIIEKEVDIYELLFSSHLGHFPLKPFVDDCFKDIQSKNDDMNIEFLECRWGAELADWGDGKEFEIYVDFHGWGSWYAEHLKERETGGIAIEFTPLYELKNLSLRLNENFRLYDGKTFKTIRKGKRKFTVYDVFGAILDELTFSGLPEQRNKKWKEIKEIKEIKNEAIEKIKKKAKKCFPSVDELFKDLKK